MTFGPTWNNLLENIETLQSGATLITPLSRKAFSIEDVQEHRVLIQYRDDDETIPLQKDQFETLYERVSGSRGKFDVDRLPPDAEPYATVLSLHPRLEVDDRTGTLTESDQSLGSPLVEAQSGSEEPDETEREEPDLDVYADALLLIDALERHDIASLEAVDTPALVNIYTLLSDVQRNANDLRKDVRSVLLDRLHHDQPVSGQFGSVQRTTRRNRALKDDELVLNAFEAAGIERERLTTVNSSKVDEALEVTELSESDVYDIESSEYVRKADVDEQEKETRLQGLKDQLEATEGDEADELRTEIEELEDRIAELTEFRSGRSFHESSAGG
jgi:polyhydroxyalkanoate synthesis regulator phasin